jgi:1,4-dihydroxy-2-naphthoate octaprenyltransferase
VVAHLVPLAGYAVFSGRVDGLAVAATAGPACAMFALMLAVEWPDYSADVAGAKTNLVVRLGLPAAARLAAGAALLSVPGLWVAVACGAPATVLIFSLLLAPVVVVFARRIAMAGAPGAEIAARGVALFVLTVLFEALGYVAALT